MVWTLGIVLGIGLSAAWAASSQDSEGLFPLGTAAPDFQLKNVMTGNLVSRDDFAGKKGLLVMFICRHCPYVQHVKGALSQLGKDYQNQDLAIVAVSSNDTTAYPQDAPESLKEMATEEGFVFPFLFDETQEVAQAYTAVCTPDLFLFDQDRKLVYRGQFDDTRPGSKEPATGKDLRAALDALLAGQPISTDQKESVGCSIKWKKGNEPKYAR